MTSPAALFGVKGAKNNPQEIKQEGATGHVFKKHCNKFIWGIGKQGYECQRCEFPAHKECVGSVPTACSGTKGKDPPKPTAGVSQSEPDLGAITRPTRRHTTVEPPRLPPPASRTLSSQVNWNDICKEGAADVLEKLAAGSSQNAQESCARSARNNSEHNTPFHISAYYGQFECLAVLVKTVSLLMNTRNKSGLTPLHLGSQKGHAKCVKCLVEAGADLNLQGNTALHHAAHRGNLECIRILLDAGAKDMANMKGKTAKERAKAGGFKECVALFEKTSQEDLSKIVIPQDIFLLGTEEPLRWLYLSLSAVQEAFDIIREDFFFFDVDGDGAISFEELSNGVKGIAGGTMSREDLSMLFQRVDMDGSKTIDSKEFLYLMYLWVGGKFFSGLPTDDAHTLKKGFKLLEQVFQLADADKSAAIDLGELKMFLAALNGIDPKDQDMSAVAERWNLDASQTLDFYTFLWILQDVELPQIVRVKFTLDGKPLEKQPHAEYGILDAVYPKQLKKAVCEEFKVSDIELEFKMPGAEGNTIELRSRLDVQKAVVAHKNRRTSKNPYMLININKQKTLEMSMSNKSMAKPASKPSIGPSASEKYSWLIKPEELTVPCLFSCGIDMEQMGDVLGRGGFGVVYKAQWKGQDVAVKTLLTEAMSVENYQGFLREIEIMSVLRCSNIVQFLGASLEKTNLCLVTEFMAKGSLNMVLKKEPKLDWKTKLSFGIDAAKGMLFLHLSTPPILHRDLKSLNLLVDHNNTVKVADFGISEFTQEQEDAPKGKLGTFNWLAPEIFAGEAYTPAADVFSYGMVQWEILTGEQPYSKLRYVCFDISPWAVLRVIEKGERPEIPPGTPKDYQALILECWNPQSKLRPIFKVIVERMQAMRAAQP